MYGKNEIRSRVATETAQEMMKIKSAQLFRLFRCFHSRGEEKEKKVEAEREKETLEVSAYHFSSRRKV